MPDYSKSKIYKIIDNTNGNIYIGSTTQRLAQRLAGHTRNFRCYLNCKVHYMTSYDIIQNNNYDIVLLETFACETKEQLHARERFHIETNDCVNKYIPTRTQKEYSEYRKEKKHEYDKIYRNENKEKKRETDRKYRENNQEKIREMKKNYIENNREKVKEQQRQKCIKSKERINVQASSQTPSQPLD